MAKGIKVLSVMRHVPLDSGFLADKFVQLGKHVDMHLMAWDTEERAMEFSQQSGVLRNKIHLGVWEGKGVIANVWRLTKVLLTNKNVRAYIWSKHSKQSVKNILSYLPVFYLSPDVIHFEFGTLARDIALLRQLSKAKFIVSFRGYDMYYVGLNEGGYYNDVWQHADGLHFLGNDLKQTAVKRGYQQDKKEAIIAPAVDTNFFTPKRHDGGNTLRILSVGRLTWRKGYDTALQAMKQLKDKGIDFTYTIVGAGEHLQAIQFMISEFGLEQYVKLTGALDKEQIKAELNNAGVFLQASVSEGFCNAVIEAQAMAVPIVCTDAGGLKENVEDNVTGFVVPAWGAIAMADRLEWCYRNKVLLSSIGNKGRERVQQHFNLQDQITAFVKFYNDIASSK